MYIIYTLFGVGRLLICQILGAVLLPVTSSLAIKALSFWLGSRLGFLHGRGNSFTTLLGVTLLTLAVFLETSGFIDHQHLMLFLDFKLSDLKHRKQLGDRLVHPLHVIVHHKAFEA